MDKKTLKVIEKYSMPFVQLVIEKGEEDSIFSDLSQIKQVAEETGLPSFLAQVAVDESDKEKTVRFFPGLCVTFSTKLYRGSTLQSQIKPVL